MKQRDLAVFLALEIFAIIWAGTMFTLLNSKLMAGALAGGYFVVSGIFMLGRANRWPQKWSSLTWYCLFIHIFGISIPMLVSRFAQISLNFAQVEVLGIPGPIFHNISTGVFAALIAATVVDYLRVTLRKTV